MNFHPPQFRRRYLFRRNNLVIYQELLDRRHVFTHVSVEPVTIDAKCCFDVRAILEILLVNVALDDLYQCIRKLIQDMLRCAFFDKNALPVVLDFIILADFTDTADIFPLWIVTQPLFTQHHEGANRSRRNMWTPSFWRRHCNWQETTDDVFNCIAVALIRNEAHF